MTSGLSLSGSILTKKTLKFSFFCLLKLLITKSILFKVIGHTSGQFVNPKKIAVKGPSKDFSVIILLLTSLRENFDPLKDIVLRKNYISNEREFTATLKKIKNKQLRNMIMNKIPNVIKNFFVKPNIRMIKLKLK